jgi:hypothetical protein
MTFAAAPAAGAGWSVVVSRLGGAAITASAGTCTSNSIAVSFFTKRTDENGRCCASYGRRVIEVSVAASFA